MATEDEVAEETEEVQEGAVAVATKPKKGKAALLLKRDRVCMGEGIFFHCFLVFDMGLILNYSDCY